MAAGRRRRGPARQARKRARALSAAARGGRAVVRLAAVITARRCLSAAGSDAGAAQGTYRGHDRRVDPGGSRATTIARGLGRCPLGRPSTLDLLGPADRPGADGAAVDRADLPHGIRAALAGALACQAVDPQPARTAADRGYGDPPRPPPHTAGGGRRAYRAKDSRRSAGRRG